MTKDEEKDRLEELEARKKYCFEWAYKIYPKAEMTFVIRKSEELYNYIFKASTDD